MKNMKFWRTALVATLVLTVMLSVTGGTIAWFTDAVESKANVIEAGNLDVELYHTNKTVTASTKVDADTALFEVPELWEPGAVAYENLTVVNEGNLALKYQMTINTASENHLNGNALSDVLKVGVVENGVTGTDRQAIVDDVKEWASFSDFVLNGVLGTETADESKTYGVVIYWQPGADDNNWNVNNGQKASDGENYLHVELGVNLQATQKTAEEDAFDDRYDVDATYEGWAGNVDGQWYLDNPEATEYTLDSAEELAALFKLVNEGPGAVTGIALLSEEGDVPVNFKGKTIKLGSDIDLESKAWTPVGNSSHKFEGIFDGQGHTISNLNVVGGNKNDMGLFGFTAGGEIKNLTVHNATVTGRLDVGVVAGTPYTSKYTNIKVTGLVKVNGMSYVGGVGGKNAYANWTDITVDVDEGSYVKSYSVENGKAYRSYVGGVVGFMGEGGHTMSNVKANIDVYGSTCDVGGIVGIAHYGNNFENVTCSGNVTITNATEAADAEEMGGIAGVWNNGGENVTLTNCKFTGELSANITEGVDLSDNTLTGKAYSSTGNGELIIDGKTNKVVDSAEELVAALDAGATTVAVSKGTYTFPASKLQAGQTLVCAEGTVFEGTSKLNIQGATVVGATFSNPTGTAADQTINGTFKNCTFTGSNGLRWCYAGETVVFENCVFSGDVYGVHFDGGANDVVFKNCTFSGFNALAGAIKQVTMEGCTFKANGKSSYNGINLWGNTKMEDCTFVFDGSADYEWVDACSANTTVEYKNCFVIDENGTKSAVKMDDKFTRRNEESTTIIINGVTQ